LRDDRKPRRTLRELAEPGKSVWLPPHGGLIGA
jgi:hypothetical protein